MTAHIVSALFGLLGGILPGTLRVAWKIRRGKRTSAGSLDLSVYRTHRD